MSSEAWMVEAECRGMSPSIFFPDAHDVVGERRAKEVCAGCPVRAECLDYALRNRERFGIFGGEGEGARRKMRRKMRRKGQTVVTDCQMCGAAVTYVYTGGYPMRFCGECRSQRRTAVNARHFQANVVGTIRSH